MRSMFQFAARTLRAPRPAAALAVGTTGLTLGGLSLSLCESTVVTTTVVETTDPVRTLEGDKTAERHWSRILPFGLPAVTRATNPKDAKKYKPHETAVVRICLTGGPCAGKSSALKALTEAANAKGYDVYQAPECATILFSNGVHFMPDRPEFVLAFMRSIVQLQLQMERTFTRIAASTGRPSILICDRGMMDNKGYISPEGWEQTLSFVNDNDSKRHFSEEYILQRYDCVIHMVTAANGAEKFYKHGWTVDDNGNKVFRHETPAMARDLDEKMLACWKDHPCRVVADNSTGFASKLNKVAMAVVEAAEKKNGQL